MLIKVPKTRECNVQIANFIVFVLLAFLPFSVSATDSENNKKYFIDANSSYYVNLETWVDAPNGGDTIFISAERTNPLRFQFIAGEQNNPVVIINTGGQVDISSETAWGAMVFENCRYIKVTGEGDEHYKYGFKLAAESCGLAFVELSSDCEAAFVKISHDGFFGIMAKKDYGGYPPNPVPVFSNLVIHDCFVENVVEGMYLGETKSPGMQFKHVRIFNNIVRNTGRESMQIANMVEDVEIYNNTLLDAGRTNENQQNNLLQIGDNSVAKVYNNIMMGAPGCGIISFGMGDNIYTNNFMSNCKGIFLDERKFTNAEAPIEIKANYFTNTIDMGWVIRNMNQYNSILIADNLYDADFNFYKNDSGNDENYALVNNAKTEIAPTQFTNVAENDYSLSLGNPAVYKDLGAPGGPEFFGAETDPSVEVPVSEQIILTPEMLVDEVEGGSYWSADYLVDEQSLTPESEEHPVSQSWKPFWNMDKGPYHVYIDLGAEYNLTAMALHDMNNTQNLEVSVGEPGNWKSLFTESCDQYLKWKNHDINVRTQYVRLSMTESVFAAVNELVLYGYKIAKPKSVQIQLNPEMLVDEVEGGSYWSADYLVDEQSLTPESEEHPVSQSWKPFWNMDKGPYHVYIDLGAEYNLTMIALHDMHDTKNLEISVGKPGSWQPLFTESCDKYKTWKEHEIDVATQYVRLSMTESVFAAVNELVFYGYKITKPKSVQIQLNPEMLVDEVEGGSYWSADYLVDEQSLTPESEEHPVSQSWKPFWNMDKGPYHVYLDLGKEYTITEIALHDMHDTKNLDVSVGDPGNWELLFTESCDKYKTWKQHETNVKTRYVRLSMTESVFAAVNEIILYGYADGEEVVAEKSAGATSTSQKELTTGIETKLETEELFLCENPVKRSLKLNVPASLNNNFRIEIFSINGARLYSEKYIESSTSQLTIDVSEYCAKSGVYLMRYSNDEGTAKCLKFVKKEY